MLRNGKTNGNDNEPYSTAEQISAHKPPTACFSSRAEFLAQKSLAWLRLGAQRRSHGNTKRSACMLTDFDRSRCSVRSFDPGHRNKLALAEETERSDDFLAFLFTADRAKACFVFNETYLES